MNDACELIQDDLAAYALGSLDPPAVQAVEAHLATCANCRATVAEYQQVTILLPLGLPLAQPTAAERSSLLARVKAQPAARPAVPARAPRPRLFARPRLLPVAALVLVVGLCLGLLFQYVIGPTFWPQPKMAAHVATLAGSANAPGANGQLVVDPGKPQAQLTVTGLPPLPADRSYQFWFVQPDQTRVSGGVFRVNESGWASVPITVPADTTGIRRIGVTEEPLAGSPGPTGRNVLGGTW